MRTILLINLCFLTVGCDIQSNLRVVNQKNETVLYQCRFSNNEEPLEFSLKSKDEPYSYGVKFYGFGQFWSKARLNEYVSSIQEIKIVSRKDSLVLKDKTELYSFLKKRRKGIFRHEIKIKIR